MTGRTCPVHGEYSESGACRWCEPLPAPDAPPPLPEGATRCRCGWMAWMDYATRPFREECNGMVHTPEQCYATAATPPAEPLTYMGAPVVVDPYATGDAVPVLVSWALTEKTLDAYRWRLEWLEEPEEYDYSRRHQYRQELLAQHDALRWERVARRWAAKGTATEHRMTVEGALAFDDHCAKCRGLAREGRWP